MIVSINQCILVTVMMWQSIFLSFSCPDKCLCNNNTLNCQTCSYNVTLKENLNIGLESVCCDDDTKIIPWLQKYKNKSNTEITVKFGTKCYNNSVDFDFPLLETSTLYMSHNNLSKVRINIEPQNLRELDLSSNKLQFITKGLFNYFSNLRKLNLSNNNITRIYEGSFDGLAKLDTLDLSVNKLRILSNIFIPLKSLQHLNLSRNNIEFIHANYFSNWLLQHLDLSHNNLKKVAPGALQLLPNLARLLLTDNPHLGITQLDTQLLVGTGRRLQQVDASRTGLYQVPEAFTHSVRFLSLVGNKISAIRCGDLDSYPLLQSLDFSDNKIVLVEDDSLGRLEMLLFLNLNKNILTAAPKSLPDELKYLSINNNLIRNLTIPDFKDLPNLRILLLRSNKIQYIQDHVFDDLLSLEMLDLSNNPIKKFSPKIFDGPLYLRDLRLCYINISIEPQDRSFPLSSPESIQMLHLQSSPGLAKQLLSDTASLAALSSLQYLDLRMNNLSNIRNDLLFYLVQLKTLRLHGNSVNCSTQFWIKDWLNSNKSIENEESCYYTSIDPKEAFKYNCTFPETFTISESLPPVNLYSTEMINKLLRYYGYLNNRTEKATKKRNNQKDILHNDNQKFNITSTKLVSGSSTLSEQIKSYDLMISQYGNEFPINKNFNGTLKNVLKQPSKFIDYELQDSQQNTHRKYEDIERNYFLQINNSKSDNENEFNDFPYKNKSGKRLNTPIEMNFKKEYTSNNKSELMKFEQKADQSTTKTEHSQYQSNHNIYVHYIGAVVVTSLTILSLILWTMMRLRYKRRRIPVTNTENLDQVEVSNISGGVLW